MRKMKERGAMERKRTTKTMETMETGKASKTTKMMKTIKKRKTKMMTKMKSRMMKTTRGMINLQNDPNWNENHDHLSDFEIYS